MTVKQRFFKETPFYLAKCEVDPRSNKFVNLNNETFSLRPKVMQVLVCLAENSRQMVERKQLIEEIWAGNGLVGTRGVTDAIWQLRKIFSNSQIPQPVIETVSRKGYILKLVPTSITQTPPRTSRRRDKLLERLFILVAIMLVVALVSSYSYLSHDNEIPKLVTPDKIKTLNQLPGTQAFARLSNDGKWAAYSYSDEAQTRLVIQGVDNSLSSLVTLDVGNKLVGFPAWSSDDSKLAYAIKNKQGACIIRIVRVLDRKKEDIEICHFGHFGGLSWSTDDQYLVFSDLYSEKTQQGLVLFNLGTKKKRSLTTNEMGLFRRDLHPIWIDEQNIIFVRSKGVDNQDIFITDLQGNIKQLTFLNSELRGLSLGLHRDSIIFSLVKSKIATLKELNLVTKKLKSLYLSDNSAVYPSYSRQNRRLLYTRYLQVKQLAKLSFSGTTYLSRGKTQLNSISEIPYVSEHYPSYSSSRNQLAFISNQNGIEQIWLKNLTSGEQESLTQENLKIYGVNWSPNGRYLAFTMEQGESGYKQIHIVDRETKVTKQITSNLTEHAPPTWAQDSQSIFTGELHGNDFYLYEYHLNGGSHRSLESPAIYGFRRGDKLYYSKYLEKGIWQYDEVSKTETRLIENLAFGDGSNWDITDNGIFFLERETDADQLMFYDFKLKQISALHRFESERVSKYENFDYDPQKRQLYLVLQPKERQHIYHVTYP